MDRSRGFQKPASLRARTCDGDFCDYFCEGSGARGAGSVSAEGERVSMKVPIMASATAAECNTQLVGSIPLFLCRAAAAAAGFSLLFPMYATAERFALAEKKARSV